MFRLLNLEVRNNPFLGNLKLDFLNKDKKTESPFTTLIIGVNGTGKSNVLRIVIDIFREIASLKNGHNKQYVNGAYIVRYKIDDDIYEFRNHLKAMKDSSFEKKAGFEILKNQKLVDVSKLKLPSRVLATAIMLNDKFPMVKSEPDDMYQYLGVRRSPSVAGTRTFIKRAVSNIADAMHGNGFLDNLEKILSFLELKQKFSIYYYPRYKKYFYDGDLTEEKFRKFFEDWEKITKRKYPPWGKKYYNKISKDNTELNKLVNFINFISSKLKKDDRGSEYFDYDVFSDKKLKEDFIQLEKLSSLDLLAYPGLSLEKESEYGLEDSSSGEYHFLSILLGIMAKIQENSLILIDEPEISLHPRWQMQYINFLRTVFKEYKNTHFLIASHSHFLVSDLKEESSSIIGLKRESSTSSIFAERIEANTYGWTPEDILYNIFEVPTVRNYYLANEIGEILSLIGKKERDVNKIKEAVSKLRKINIKLKDEDPLKEIIEELVKNFG